jgi:hypothetical protein
MEQNGRLPTKPKKKNRRASKKCFFSMTYDFIEQMKLESNNRLQEYANVCAGEKEVNKLVL